MLELQSTLSKEEYENFAKRSYFTIRRDGKFWSGTWTDMVIEQSLMRPMKSVGGLTHGRGITDNTLTKWILGAPYCLKIQEAIDNFAGIALTFNELRESRKKRDTMDVEKFTTWLRQHNPFRKLSGELVCLSSGYVSDDKVNCDSAYEVGLKAMKNMSGKTFGELKLKRKDMVVTQASHKSVSFRSRNITINPQQLFNRILCVCDSPDKLKTYLQYELASLSPSIFDDFSLRKCTKSSIVKVFSECITEQPPLENSGIVIDGGFLLHHVTWPNNSTYGEITDNYASFVLSKFGTNSTVVFDGYPEEPTTKGVEQRRRCAKYSSCNIQFDIHTKSITKKEAFLSNKNNKKMLIEALHSKLIEQGLSAEISKGDADVNIVKKGIEMTNHFSKAIVVGTDTDLLILLIALAPEKKVIYLWKDVGGRNTSTVCYDIQKLVECNKIIRLQLLFAHAVTGCDTTSSFFGIGKTKAVEIIKKISDAKQQATTFTEKDVSKDDIIEEGEKFILSLYGLDKYSTLNEARYYRFTTLTRKSTLKSNFDLAKLPPTSEACHQHLLRVYLQVQCWLGNDLHPADWGWRYEYVKENGGRRKVLRPITSSKAVAPEDLLCLVSCSCKTGCGNYCRCRQSGMNCSAMCEHCNGLSCSNVPQFDDDVNEIDNE